MVTDFESERQQMAPARGKQIRVHFYLGEVCRSEMVDLDLAFESTRQRVLLKFGVQPSEVDAFAFKLMNGGPVESAEVLFHDDRVMLVP